MNEKIFNGKRYVEVADGEIIKQGDVWGDGQPAEFVVGDPLVGGNLYRPIPEPTVKPFPPEAIAACPPDRELFWGDEKDHGDDLLMWLSGPKSFDTRWADGETSTAYIYARKKQPKLPRFPTAESFTAHLANALKTLSAGAAIDEAQRLTNGEFAKAHQAIIREHVERLLIAPFDVAEMRKAGAI